MITQEAFNHALENKKLVAGALKAAHVYRTYDSYEDFLQDGVIIYAEMITKYPEKQESEVDKLAFRKIIWHTLDELRKTQRNSEKSADLDTAYELGETGDWDLQLVINEQVAQMNELKKLVFSQHLINRVPLVHLVASHGYSRSTLQRVKKELLAQLGEALES